MSALYDVYQTIVLNRDSVEVIVRAVFLSLHYSSCEVVPSTPITDWLIKLAYFDDEDGEASQRTGRFSNLSEIRLHGQASHRPFQILSDLLIKYP